jgi:hypothetical protein
MDDIHLWGRLQPATGFSPPTSHIEVRIWLNEDRYVIACTFPTVVSPSV